MILEFVDNSQLVVSTIIGGPAHVNDRIRDVLTIEVKPNTISLEDLKEKFNNPANLAYLYTYQNRKNSSGVTELTRIEIGEGYTIVLGIEKIRRRVKTFPGKIIPNNYEEIYRVNVAQMTYEEWIASGYATNTNKE